MSASFPPSPDTTILPHHRYEILECLYSSDSKYRAMLLRDDNGLFRVSYEMWDLSEWEQLAYAFWSPVGKGATIVDSLENARLLARERLVKLDAATDSNRGV